MRGLLLLCLVASLSGCIYRFTGGGLPGHVRTVAVLPFDKTGTAATQPLIETDIQRALQQAFPRNLGVRVAEQSLADAVVRGKVTGYEEVPVSYTTAAPGETVPVVQRQVRLTFDAEIYDMKKDVVLWRGQSQSVVGNYQPDTETEQDGRVRAIKELINKVIEGAQSQW